MRRAPAIPPRMRSSSAPRSSTAFIPSSRAARSPGPRGSPIWAARKSSCSMPTTRAILRSARARRCASSPRRRSPPCSAPIIPRWRSRRRRLPIATDFAKAYTSFLGELKQAGRKVDAIAIVNENTDYGTSVAASISDAANKSGIKVAAQIPYNANGSDVSGQVLQLKQLAPDAVIFISYTADTILYFKTLKNLDYTPPMIIGDDAGFSDPAFIPAVGEIAQGAMNRSAWDLGKPGGNSYT